MANYQVKEVSVKTVVKTMSFVMAILGVVVGLVTFFILPNEIARHLTFGVRLLSCLIFTVVYTLLMVAVMIFVTLIYNWVSGKTGGITVSLDEER